MTATISFGQTTERYRVFDGTGKEQNLAAILDAAAKSDVLFLGEMHDDAVGHALQLEIFDAIVRKHAAERKIALSLEMFERDVQIVLDEYLAGLITENHLMLSARPWNNYKTDYRPLVEIAKANKLPVLAANAPRRYVNMVSRGGKAKLDGLSEQAKRWLAPLPFSPASAGYESKFKALMGPSPEAQMGLGNILESQSLWDATMAWTVSSFLKANKKPLVVHLNGSFHTETRLGTAERTLEYSPKAKITVVTVRYEKDFRTFDPAKHAGLGDFVVLTDDSVERSFKR